MIEADEIIYNMRIIIFNEKEKKWNRPDKYIEYIRKMQDKRLREVGIKE